MLNAKKYDLHGYIPKNNVILLTKEFSKKLIKMSGKCMDIGCGPGEITKNILMPALNPKTVMIGTDISEEMIEYANKTYGDNEQLQFETLNIETTTLPEKYISSFDNIFSFHTLNWCQDIRKAFENIHQMLRPGGNMIVILVANHSVFDSFKTMAEDKRFAQYVKEIKQCVSSFHNVDQSSEKLKELLENIGFYIHHCSLREKSHAGTDTFLSMIASILPFLKKMPHKLSEEFLNDFKRNFISTGITESKQFNNNLFDNQEQQDFICRYTVLVVHAQKNV